MNKMKIKRAMILLALGGSTFFAAFGAGGPFGCNYATNLDYENVYTAAGQATIQEVSDAFFSFGTDWDTIIRNPATAFAQAIWGNWVDQLVPNNVELH